MFVAVAAAWNEPMPGWVENPNGLTGIILGAGKGILRTLHCKAEANSNIVPVDVVINALIVLAWKLSKSPKKKELLVYNITSDQVCYYCNLSTMPTYLLHFAICFRKIH